MTGKQLAVQRKFDYDMLDKDAGGKLRYFAGEIRRKQKQAAAVLMEIAKDLKDALDAVGDAGGPAHFKHWVEAEFSFTVRTAYRYISIYRRFSDCDLIERYEDGALRQLSEPGFVAMKAYTQAYKFAERGGIVTKDIARDLIKQAEPDESPGEPEEVPEEEPQDELPEELSPTVAQKIKSGELDVTSEEVEALMEYEKPAQCKVVATMETEGHETVAEAIEADVESQKPPQLRMEESANRIETLAKTVSNIMEEVPDEPLFNKNRLDIINSQLKQVASSIRLAKGVALCNVCNGDGCKKCHQAGWHNRQDAKIQESLLKAP